MKPFTVHTLIAEPAAEWAIFINTNPFRLTSKTDLEVIVEGPFKIEEIEMVLSEHAYEPILAECLSDAENVVFGRLVYMGGEAHSITPRRSSICATVESNGRQVFIKTFRRRLFILPGDERPIAVIARG